jgi:hypothetical protein
VKNDAISHDLVIFVVWVQHAAHYFHLLHVVMVELLRVDLLFVLGQFNLPSLLACGKFILKIVHLSSLVILACDDLLET